MSVMMTSSRLSVYRWRLSVVGGPWRQGNIGKWHPKCEAWPGIRGAMTAMRKLALSLRDAKRLENAEI